MLSFIRKYWLHLAITFIFIVVISIEVTAIISRLANRNNLDLETVAPQPETEIEQLRPLPDFINLQPTIDAWLTTLPRNTEVGLMIYDLDHNQVAAEYHPDEVFDAASIYKLFFAYDGYRQIAKGLESSETFFVTARDNFHSGQLTLGDCLDLIIRESYNTCAEPMRDNPERFARIEALTAELGLKNTSEAGLYSTAADLTELLKLYYKHPDLPTEAWAKIQDSMLNQPITTDDWRQGLPSGFSNHVIVYDKVGWGWNIFNDAAIIEFPTENRSYIVVILTNLNDNKPLINLGQAIEAAVVSNSQNVL